MTADTMSRNKPSVGVIGAGRMGTPIIGHLVKKGFTTTASDLNLPREATVIELGAAVTRQRAAAR